LHHRPYFFFSIFLFVWGKDFHLGTLYDAKHKAQANGSVP
jgi:hypothetical protein